MIDNKYNTIKQALFYFTRVILSDVSSSHFTYSSAHGTWTLVYPVGYPHYLAVVTLAGTNLSNWPFIFEVAFYKRPINISRPANATARDLFSLDLSSVNIPVFFKPI